MNPVDDDETPMQTSITRDVIGNSENNEAGFLELHEANYISSEAFKEFMKTTLKRNDRILTNDRMQVNDKVHTLLLNLTESMKVVFLDIVSATPDDRKWVILHNQKPRVLRSMTGHVNVLGWNMHVAVTTFRLEVTPFEVFDFLVKKNVELQVSLFHSAFLIWNS